MILSQCVGGIRLDQSSASFVQVSWPKVVARSYHCVLFAYIRVQMSLVCYTSNSLFPQSAVLCVFSPTFFMKIILKIPHFYINPTFFPVFHAAYLLCLVGNIPLRSDVSFVVLHLVSIRYTPAARPTLWYACTKTALSVCTTANLHSNLLLWKKRFRMRLRTLNTTSSVNQSLCGEVETLVLSLYLSILALSWQSQLRLRTAACRWVKRFILRWFVVITDASSHCLSQVLRNWIRRSFERWLATMDPYGHGEDFGFWRNVGLFILLAFQQGIRLFHSKRLFWHVEYFSVRCAL